MVTPANWKIREGIQFKGLGLVKKWTNRKELEEIIFEFMAEHGVIGFFLKISFIAGDPPVSDDGEVVYGNYWANHIKIFVQPIGWISEFFNVLGHELDHFDWDLSGLDWDSLELPYENRAHELRALKTGEEFVAKYAPVGIEMVEIQILDEWEITELPVAV